MKAAVDGAVNGLNDNLSGAYTENRVVLGNSGTGLKASEYIIGADTDTYEAKPDAKKLATEASIYKLAHEDLAALNTEISTFVSNIQ